MFAILHEGNTNKSADNNLLKLLINNLGLEDKKIRFFGLGTKSNFFKSDNTNYKELLTEINEETILKVLFIIDADYEKNDNIYGGYKNTQKELNKVIKNLLLENISDVYITCDPKTNDGYLESLILSSIPNKQKECIETFLECSEFKSKDNHKAILNQIYTKAYPKAPYDFSHSNFDELKQKLKELFN